MKPIDYYYTCLIYHSAEGSMWVAHSLHMDQLGMGKTPQKALKDMVKAVGQVYEMGVEDSSINIDRNVPIVQMLEHIEIDEVDMPNKEAMQVVGSALSTTGQ